MEQKKSRLRMLLWQSGPFDSESFDSHRKFIFWIFILSTTLLNGSFTYSAENFWGFTVNMNVLVDELKIIALNAVLADVISYALLHKFSVIHKAVKFLVIAAGALVFITDMFMLYHWHRVFDSQMLDIVLVATKNESFEFLETYLINSGFILFMAAVAAIVFILYRLRKAVLVLVAILIVCVIPDMFFPETFKMFTLERMPKYLDIGHIALTVQESREEMRKYRAVLDAKPKEVMLTKNDSSIPYTVFILGESTARNHMAIYGYNLPTTPNLIKRKQEGGLYVFTDAVSPHSYTIIVLEKLFNFYRYGASGEWYTYTNIFDILRAAGVHTAWLTNQESMSPIYPPSLYSSACDDVAYVETNFSWRSVVAYDGELLPLLDDELRKSTGKNFYVLHLMGTHNTYRRRYPPEYASFTASDETGGYDGITDTQKEKRAQYDNAVLYNDFIVDEIIRRFEEKNAIVIYVSDHGQEVYDEADIATHGGERPYRNIIEIPMIIWLSEKFRASYPELEARIAASVDRPYMTDDMIHTLLDILGIETPEYEAAKSIINPNFDSSRPRIYSGQLYDKDTGLHALQ